MSESLEREEVLLRCAIGLAAKDRLSFLEATCAADAALRVRLEARLAAHGQSPSKAGDLPAGGQTTWPESPALVEAPGKTIGPYKLLEKIGEGGFGVVYAAEQREPVKRRVALKIIKLGMDTRQVVARFEAERQALAMMDHPNIAKVLDGGSTGSGRPYFVMELVRGIKVTEYCDQNRFSTKQRLELFIQVCHAIQHAHQKGIIHRDIKPSNILVSLHDGAPVPKVIDFGIAKATQQELTDKTLYTQLQQFIGTPVYMSPEQAEMSGLDVDTRSDIYSLGVLLYELLTGSTPFDPQDLMKMGVEGMRRTIREQEPQRPSTKLATLQGQALTMTAARHSADGPRLVHLLRGDLDWIVMKCLEKDRTRRYETANGLAVDLRRQLSNQPVSARPTSRWYQLEKAIRRNRLAYTAAGSVAGALLLGIVASTWQAVRATQAKRDAEVATSRAVASEKEQAHLRAAAEQEAAWSQKITEASVAFSHSGEGGGEHGGSDQAEKLLSEIPLQGSMAGLFGSLGDSRASYGKWRAAIADFEKLHQLRPRDAEEGGLALLYFKVGDMQGYERCRSDILEKVGAAKAYRTTRSYVTSPAYLTRTCLVVPPSQSQLKALQTLMEGAATSKTYSPQVAKALLEYRQSLYAETKRTLEGMLADQAAPKTSAFFVNIRIQAQILLAMTRRRLSETEAARAAFAAALELADQTMVKPGNDLGAWWDEWLMAHFLMHEAAEMMPEVIASNRVFAGILAEDPGWRIALDNARIKYTAGPAPLDDGTWELDLDGQNISDLSPLRGAAISRLSANHTEVSDLSPLEAMPLKGLLLAGAKVTDLGPLRGLPLMRLNISGTAVSDLSPLDGMPLRDLWLANCPGVTDLKVLKGIRTLETLELPKKGLDIQFLRSRVNFPYLNRIGYRHDAVVNGPDKTAQEFWAEYDKAPTGKASR